MGVDFRATALIGVELDKSKMKRVYRERGCEHSITESLTAIFCETCGKHIWINSANFYDVFREEPDVPESIALKNSAIFENYYLATTTDDEGIKNSMIWSEPRRIFIGRKVSTWSDDGQEAKMLGISDDARQEIWNDLQKFLEPYGLWDESKFGLWAIAYVSY